MARCQKIRSYRGLEPRQLLESEGDVCLQAVSVRRLVILFDTHMYPELSRYGYRDTHTYIYAYIHIYNYMQLRTYTHTHIYIYIDIAIDAMFYVWWRTTNSEKLDETAGGAGSDHGAQHYFARSSGGNPFFNWLQVNQRWKCEKHIGKSARTACLHMGI